MTYSSHTRTSLSSRISPATPGASASTSKGSSATSTNSATHHASEKMWPTPRPAVPEAPQPSSWATAATKVPTTLGPSSPNSRPPKTGHPRTRGRPRRATHGLDSSKRPPNRLKPPRPRPNRHITSGHTGFPKSCSFARTPRRLSTGQPSSAYQVLNDQLSDNGVDVRYVQAPIDGLISRLVLDLDDSLTVLGTSSRRSGSPKEASSQSSSLRTGPVDQWTRGGQWSGETASWASCLRLVMRNWVMPAQALDCSGVVHDWVAGETEGLIQPTSRGMERIAPRADVDHRDTLFL
jgi:hypothetical protein